MDLMRMSVPPTANADSPECHGNISAMRVSPGGVSAESFDGSDIIPFRDSEYEEIDENDLMFSYTIDSDVDQNSCKSTVEKNLEPMSSESMEAGLDSALGRSVSNPSLHLDNRCSLPTMPVNNTEPNMQPSRTSGMLDFGYSSEGQSNEEPENVTSGKHGLGNSTAGGVAVDNRLDEEAVSNNPGLDSASTSGIGTNTVQRRDLYCITDASINESAANSIDKSHLYSSLYRERIGYETDDDFTGLNELPLDDALSASELDLLAKMATLSDNNRTRLKQMHGRSLDSLAPLGSDRLFSAEKRISSVEIIVDSVTNSSRPSISSQMSRDSTMDENLAVNSFLPQTSAVRHKFSAPSSCDASSEGTVSDSEFSDFGNGDASGSPLKSHFVTRRVRRSVRSGQWKSFSSTPVKSPTKRRMENLPEIPMAVSHMSRSASHGAIDLSHQQDCSRVKKSRICQSMSDLQDGQFSKKAAASRGSRSNKVPMRRSAQKLNFANDMSDHEASYPAAAARESGLKSQYDVHYICQQSTGVYMSCAAVKTVESHIVDMVKVKVNVDLYSVSS